MRLARAAGGGRLLWRGLDVGVRGRDLLGRVRLAAWAGAAVLLQNDAHQLMVGPGPQAGWGVGRAGLSARAWWAGLVADLVGVAEKGVGDGDDSIVCVECWAG